MFNIPVKEATPLAWGKALLVSSRHLFEITTLVLKVVSKSYFRIFSGINTSTQPPPQDKECFQVTFSLKDSYSEGGGDGGSKASDGRDAINGDGVSAGGGPLYDCG